MEKQVVLIFLHVHNVCAYVCVYVHAHVSMLTCAFKLQVYLRCLLSVSTLFFESGPLRAWSSLIELRLVSSPWVPACPLWLPPALGLLVAPLCLAVYFGSRDPDLGVDVCRASVLSLR